ncbi:DUF3866 family protein [Thermotalea metallivorans]|uniref:DUF3866 domain-containing protein n=1 Tax=Thermotalea metallivorans TaxID=520762 RepID=A0A140L8E5_9FIRM|nr:DUF3866 family protein [Thermotalea metallivorans]KXG76820.1 hypothetical protein AN619_08120 [Thermotalea metallivorans]
MISVRYGKAVEIISQKETTMEVMVEIDNERYKAINYNRLTGFVEIGDTLLLNTTAVDLNLGTGGYHFVISNITKAERTFPPGGHIMKLRYTPFQLKVFAAEEQESKYHDIFNKFQSLDSMPVIVGTLHSMLPAIVEVLKFFHGDLKIAYVMTDAAALPLDFSNLVYQLKRDQKIAGTITIGHAFGGDIECINIYNGLIAAKEIINAHVAVVTMGPGIVGTGTKFGFTGIEQGNIIDAVNDLGGIPIAVPRISFADRRQRHYGISHHTLTVLDTICKTAALVGIPIFDEGKHAFILHQLEGTGIKKKHRLIFQACNDIEDILENSPIQLKTMGRNFEQEKEFFMAAGLSGKIAIDMLNDHQSSIAE